MSSLRQPVRLPWAPPGLRVELEVPARRDADGQLRVIPARGGGVRPRRAWLMAADDGAEPHPESLLAGDARWVLAAASRRWRTVEARYDDPKAQAEQLARAGAVEIECRLSTSLSCLGYAGWRLCGWALHESQRRAVADERIRTDLEIQLREDHLVARLRRGDVPRGMSWSDFVRVLRAAEKWLDLTAHGTGLPQERELAAHASGDSKWRWTDSRRALLGELVAAPPDGLFARRPRVVIAQGPVDGLQTNVFDIEVASTTLRLTGWLAGIVCVENRQSFNALYPFAARGWFVLHVPGYAPPAEQRLLARVHALAPQAPVYAAFDPDPDGIHIATLLREQTGVRLSGELMDPQLLDIVPERRLVAADHQLLARLAGRAGPLEPLRRAIQARAIKGEQEPANPWLVERLTQLSASAGR